jgi:hypothetical protein
MSAFPFLRVALPCLLLLGMMPALRALDGSEAFTLDIPFGANQATPAWLGHPETPGGTFATLDLPIVPPSADASLLVTVFFQEKDGGFLRVGWQDGEDAQVLSDNFYDGIGMSNQRSLLVSPQTMKQSGSLTFQSGSSDLVIQRIRLEWLENQTGITSPAIPDVLVTPANGATTLASNLNGQPQPADSAIWHDRVVNVPVTDAPLRIEQGVEFNVQLESIPASARLTVNEAGLPWGQHLVVWIDGQRAGAILPAVPELGDGGYASPAPASAPYVGWREGTLFVPVSSLTAGANTVQFSAESDTTAPVDAANPAPLAVKNVAFQFDYPTPPDSSTAIPSTNAAPVETPTAAPDPTGTPGESPVQAGLLSLPLTNAP